VKRLIAIWLLVSALSACSIVAANEAIAIREPVDYVNVFIGTDKFEGRTRWGAYGGTYPGAVAPFGMIQMTPETSRREPRGYYYSQSQILGFSLVNHKSGYPNGSAGDLFIMPFVGDLSNIEEGYSASFSHANEQASPGYYRVLLDDYDIEVEFAAAQRSGMVRFTFPEGRDAYIIIEVGKENLTVDNNCTTISGVHKNYWFVMEFEQPFSVIGEVGQGVYVCFAPSSTKTILMKVGMSMVSINGAQVNMDTELLGWDFDGLRKKTSEAWAKELGKIDISGGTYEQKTIFYTALYHSFLLPHVSSDVDGHYRGADGQVYLDLQRTHYTVFSPWDTFRTLHPLLTLLMPDRQSDMVHSLITMYEQSGRLLTGPMTGNHAVPIIVDSYFKGAANFDIGLAYQAMHAALLEPPYGRPDIAEYTIFGYVPAELDYSVTKTLEYSYDDWALSRIAELLGKIDDKCELLKRALYYRNVFNGSIRLMMPKYSDGSWAEDREGFLEGDAWTYSWCVPHNVQDLINLMGGREAFSELLDRCFEEGYYIHDNEPPLHYAYLYSYAGQPWKTQERVHIIMEQSYLDEPGGLPGNDDLGSLSSWYVFSALGFYPVCPGMPYYVLGSPIFANATVYLPNGKQLVIDSPMASSDNIYIQTAKFNDLDLGKPWIEHSMLASGGILHIDLDSEPDKEWGTQEDKDPYSMTTGKPLFEVSNLCLSTNTVNAGESFGVDVTVKNMGSEPGTTELRLLIDGEHMTSKWVLVNPGEILDVSIETQLYALGTHDITVNMLEPQTILVKAGLPF